MNLTMAIENVRTSTSRVSCIVAIAIFMIKIRVIVTSTTTIGTAISSTISTTNGTTNSTTNGTTNGITNSTTNGTTNGTTNVTTNATTNGTTNVTTNGERGLSAEQVGLVFEALLTACEVPYPSRTTLLK